MGGISIEKWLSEHTLPGPSKRSFSEQNLGVLSPDNFYMSICSRDMLSPCPGLGMKMEA